MSQLRVEDQTAGRSASAESSRVFAAGLPTYLRFRWGVLNVLAPVVSHGITTPGNLLSVQWQDKAANPHIPDEGTPVTCHALSNGVLYAARGEVTSSGDGPQPRLRIQLDPACVAVPLRQHERYDVNARLQLVDEDQATILEYRSPQNMNISLGGFGLETRPLGLKPGKVLGYTIEIVQRSGEEESVLPLNGAATVRMCTENRDRGVAYLGLQFCDPDQQQTQALELWLAAHQTGLRGSVQHL